MIAIIIYWTLAYAVTWWMGIKFFNAPMVKMMVAKVPKSLQIIIGAYLAIWVSPFVLPWYIYWVFMKFVWLKLYPPKPVITYPDPGEVEPTEEAPEYVDFTQMGVKIPHSGDEQAG